MKNNIYRKVLKRVLSFTLLLTPCTTLLTSCDDWLAIQPEAEIEGTELYSSESGFKDALTGIYIKMGNYSMYGREMTFGFLDVIGHCYYNAGPSGSAYYNVMNNYDYTSSSITSYSNMIWSNMYNTLSNLNYLIENLEKADPAMFSRDNYNVIKGEALGLRAFLHFDLLRLFAPSWVADKDADAIPYVTEYTYTITETSTVSQVMDYILKDLNEAIELLRVSDPIKTGREITSKDDNMYLTNRQFHFNYYAAVATLARVSLWKYDYPTAMKCAQEVIDCEKFRWTRAEEIATTSEANRDRTFKNEHVFALNIDNLEDNVDRYLYGTTTYNSYLAFSLYAMNNGLFPTSTHSTDWRRVYLMSNEYTSMSSYYTNKKLLQEGMDDNMVKRMPIIRLPEMYLIKAQADIENSAEYLNTIRENRGVTAKVAQSDSTVMQEEILKETCREFMCEGHLFYYYKRLNMTRHRYMYWTSWTNFDPALYVLPLPEEEKEFGNR
ncbi:MAG: RagB/SusD family nutrient uptake outer membrane protein [Prevotella sp.]|nr:RagB/SusD family nutrient uptake outer membrane protein [Prevotella sp.]MBQ9222421.1 RagB/SusD family nutrient uptake outer membrane protein [Prevotella sp.]